MQHRLSRGTLRGIWVPLIVCWTESNELDAQRYAREIRSFRNSGIHGLYTGGTTGEFYAQDDSTFTEIAKITCREAHDIGLPVQIGCTALSTRIARERIGIAITHGADAIQIALPSWLELREDEVFGFFRDAAVAAGDTPIVLYQTGRAKTVISSAQLHRLAAEHPALIGTKDTGCDPEALKEMLTGNPPLAIFGGDRDIAEKIQHGGRGAYSAVALLNSHLMLRLYQRAAEGNTNEAEQIQSPIRRLFDEVFVPWVTRDGLMDSAIDRVQRIVGGGDVNLECQRPYRSATAAHVRVLQQWCQKHAPILLPR